MSSILTNTGAMTALQTLRGINSNLEKTQDMISTGKKVATAKDSAAIWAVAKVMESDTSAFQSVADQLTSGAALISVARAGGEQVTEVLRDLRDVVTAAQNPASDQAQLDAEGQQLIAQIDQIVASAQFNGINLIDGSSASVDILGALARDAAGVVTNEIITVNGTNLSTAQAGGPTGTLTAVGALTVAGNTLGGPVAAGSTDQGFVLAGIVANETVSVTIDGQTFSYTATATDTGAGNDANIIAVNALRDQINAAGITGLTAQVDATAGELIFINDGAGNVDRGVQAQVDGPGAIALGALDAGAFDASGIAADTIDNMISATVGAVATFGVAEKRLEQQASFTETLISSMKKGVGALVDANMEEASARLQALQVQQQLGVQALSIANQAPQTILALFR
jgi:flagellin